jgi:hypothetical protein
MFYLPNLTRARAYGIAKEKYVAQCMEYDANYVTQFGAGDSVIAQTDGDFALQMEDTNGLPEVFLDRLVDMETMEANGLLAEQGE